MVSGVVSRITGLKTTLFGVLDEPTNKHVRAVGGNRR